MTGLEFTLLIALGVALVLGAIAHRLGVPPMIGYIAAGLAVGPSASPADIATAIARAVDDLELRAGAARMAIAIDEQVSSGAAVEELESLL